MNKTIFRLFLTVLCLLFSSFSIAESKDKACEKQCAEIYISCGGASNNLCTLSYLGCISGCRTFGKNTKYIYEPQSNEKNNDK